MSDKIPDSGNQFHYETERDDVNNFLRKSNNDVSRASLTEITPINLNNEENNMENSAFTNEAISLKEKYGEYVYVLPVEFEAESREDLKPWILEVDGKSALAVQKLDITYNDCGDGRPNSKEDNELKSGVTSPVRSFGGFAGMAGTLFEYLKNQNDLLENDPRTEDFINAFYENIDRVMNTLGLNFHVHTDNHQGEDNAYYAGCAHVAGLTGRIPEFADFMSLIMDQDEDSVVIDTRQDSHLEHGLVVTKGSFTLFREYQDQFFTIDSSVKNLLSDVINAWNLSSSDTDENFQLYLSKSGVTELFVDHMVGTANKLVISSGKPITLVDTSSVKPDYLSDEPSAEGNIKVKKIDSNTDSLKNILMELLS